MREIMTEMKTTLSIPSTTSAQGNEACPDMRIGQEIDHRYAVGDCLELTPELIA